jgi:hypothetical protein
MVIATSTGLFVSLTKLSCCVDSERELELSPLELELKPLELELKPLAQLKA